MHEIIRLENGVRIICERMPGVRSAAFGIFINSGSRNEAPGENGSAHFIEHMFNVNSLPFACRKLTGSRNISNRYGVDVAFVGHRLFRQPDGLFYKEFVVHQTTLQSSS